MASPALRLYRRLGGSAPGRWLFARLIRLRAPYFASIAPRIDVLEPGHSVVVVRDRRAVRNHIGTVHAIALCNMAELAAGLATDAVLPDTMRWIPKGMTVRYLAKARGTMTATARVSPPPDVDGIEQHAMVEIRDGDGTAVLEADIAMWITRRRGA